MPSIVTGVPAAVLDVDAGKTWTTSGTAAVLGVGSEPGVMVSVSVSAGSTWLAKIWVYWPAVVSASPIWAVWVPLMVVQLPRILSRCPQQSTSPGEVQSALVPPYPSLYIQAKSAPSGV